jgi:hypothetical protein
MQLGPLRNLKGARLQTTIMGAGVFLEETQLTPGMDAEEATRQRCREFDAREAKATDQLNFGSARRS